MYQQRIYHNTKLAVTTANNKLLQDASRIRGSAKAYKHNLLDESVIGGGGVLDFLYAIIPRPGPIALIYMSVYTVLHSTAHLVIIVNKAILLANKYIYYLFIAVVP